MRLKTILLAIFLCCFLGCGGAREGARTGAPKLQAPKPQGPEQYSAVVVRTVNSGGNQTIEETRIAVSGAMTREDWTEDGERRALIVRPDLGKSFLLLLDKKTYTESSLGPDTNGSGPGSSEAARSVAPNDAGSRELGAAQDSLPKPQEPDTSGSNDRDWVIDDAPPPVRSEEHPLPDQMIDNHKCKASEKVDYFQDGHTERTRTYRAIDLEGLALRVESESGSGPQHSSMTTDRRDIHLDVDPAEFSVASDFKRIGQ